MTSKLHITPLLAFVILAACQGGGDSADHAHPTSDSVPLFANLGTYHRTITTSSPEAQNFFDQGLRLSYAFNHAEAIRAFERATKIDTACAICYWGIAYAYGPNINVPMDSASGVAAYAAAQRAKALAAGASEVERALIDAMAQRYTEIPVANRASLDSAYANAMKGVKTQFPTDLDASTIYAEAVMNLSPWDYWTKEGQPRPATPEVLSDLERVMAANTDHPGACHYYIHAVEAVDPVKAVTCAERLAALMPGAGHIVHMPAHIYIRVGRWDEAIKANEHAVHTDSSYIADQKPNGVYPIAYYPHNWHFLSFAATMSGKSTQAINAARAVSEKVTPEVARAAPPVEGLIPHYHLTLVRFGKWDEALGLPVPPSDLRIATALVQYARGTAHAAKKEEAQAKVALDTLRAIVAATKDPLSHAILDVANHALAGEIALRSEDLTGAEGHFRQAMAIEDELQYMEPPHWYYPIRHSLGSVLLAHGKAADAEQLFRQDLVKFPENTWSLHGLRASLTAQGKAADASAIDARIAKLGGDVKLTSARY